MPIRRLNSTDDPQWLRMRDALWPGLPLTHLQAEMVAIRASTTAAVFVVDRGNGQLGGFLELSQRSAADGCTTGPVAYIEAWYVDPDLRRTGIGRALVQAAEQYARDTGYQEIASDCDLENDVSFQAHRALGYQETLRLIHFHKGLTSG